MNDKGGNNEDSNNASSAATGGKNPFMTEDEVRAEREPLVNRAGPNHATLTPGHGSATTSLTEEHIAGLMFEAKVANELLRRAMADAAAAGVHVDGVTPASSSEQEPKKPNANLTYATDSSTTDGRGFPYPKSFPRARARRPVDSAVESGEFGISLDPNARATAPITEKFGLYSGLPAGSLDQNTEPGPPQTANQSFWRQRGGKLKGWWKKTFGRKGR